MNRGGGACLSEILFKHCKDLWTEDEECYGRMIQLLSGDQLVHLHITALRSVTKDYNRGRNFYWMHTLSMFVSRLTPTKTYLSISDVAHYCTIYRRKRCKIGHHLSGSFDRN